MVIKAASGAKQHSSVQNLFWLPPAAMEPGAESEILKKEKICK